MGSFEGGQVYRKTQRIAETFQCAVKCIKHRHCSNSRHIQVMELVFVKLILSENTLRTRYFLAIQ